MFTPYKSWIRHKNGEFKRGQVVAVVDDVVKVSYLEVANGVSGGTQRWFKIVDVELCD